jgi:hypothetical protein
MLKGKFVNNVLRDVINYDEVIKQLDSNLDSELRKINSRKSDKTEQEKEKLRKIAQDYHDTQKNMYDEDYIELVIDSEDRVRKDEFDAISARVELCADGRLHQRFNVTKNSPVLIKNKIEELKNELSSTDYIIIKIQEAKLVMNDSPYSSEYIDDIVNKRQSIREEINRLEELLN